MTICAVITAVYDVRPTDESVSSKKPFSLFFNEVVTTKASLKSTRKEPDVFS